MANESDILFQALVNAGDDYAKTRVGEKALGRGVGLYALLHEEPVTSICDRLAQKLNEQGYRVMKIETVSKS